MVEQSVERVDVDGHPAWAKRYGNEPRRFRLALLDAVVRLLGVPALRPPPRHAGDAARGTEQRRIQQLADAGVLVPTVLRSCLLYTSPSPRDRSLSRMPSSA